MCLHMRVCACGQVTLCRCICMLVSLLARECICVCMYNGENANSHYFYDDYDTCFFLALSLYLYKHSKADLLFTTKMRYQKY